MKQNNIVVFLFAVIFLQKIVFVGWIYIGEILSCVYFLFNFHRLNFSEFEKKLIFFSFFAAILQLLLDSYHQTDIIKLLKGIFTYPVFAVVVIFLTRYLRNEKDFTKSVVFFLGAFVGKYITFFYGGNDFFLSNPWKWGLAKALIVFVLIIPLLYKKDFSKTFFILFSFIIAYFSFIYYSRSMFLVFALSLVIYLLCYNSNKFSLNYFRGKFTCLFYPILWFFVVVIIGIVVAKINPGQVSKQAAFEKVIVKTQEQSQGPFGVIIGARTDLISAVYAIKDSPLLGHGSYAVDKGAKYFAQQMDFMYRFELIQFFPDIEVIQSSSGEKIRSHSYLAEAMIATGILGGLFWVFLTQFIVRSFANYSNHLPFFFHFGITEYIYNLFFSAWGAPHRIYLSMFLAIFILYLELIKENKLEIEQNKGPNKAGNLQS